MPSTEPAVESTFSDPPQTAKLRSALDAACGGQEQTVYALLDGARIPRLWKMLRELKIEHAPLFRTSPKENIIHVTPFLVRTTPSGDMPVWMTLQPEVLAAAVFLVSRTPPDELRHHFRRFLLVRHADGRSVYLRFYDPRVLAPFLAVSNDLERRRFFGPVQKFFAHDAEESEKTHDLAFRKWALTEQQQAIPLPPPPDSHQLFQLRQEHDDEFARVAMASYDRRAVDYLCQRYPGRLKEKPEAEVLAFVNEAKALGPKIGLTAGRDITHLSEILVLGASDEMKKRLARVPDKDRSHAVVVLRDRLASGEAH